MQSDMKKILMMFFALMTGVTAASAQLSSGDFFEGLSRKIGFSRMIAPHGLEITYDKRYMSYFLPRSSMWTWGPPI